MIPVVALVGRPNVGKSTLFNRLTLTCDALVVDCPGLTRDRKYGRAKWKDKEFIVIDTGGIDDDQIKGIAANIARQTLLAIEEADIVLFIVDGRAGLMAADLVIAKHLRKSQKNTVVIANKTEGIAKDSAMSDFYALGMGNIVPISASHGTGINYLREQIILPLVNACLQVEDAEKWLYEEAKTETLAVQENQLFNQQSQPIKLAIIGRPNVGKSTLINRLVGEERVIVYDMPGTTRDSIYVPMVHDGQQYLLIDTAGVRKRRKVTGKVEKFSVIKTIQAIEDANVVLLVLDAHQCISDQDLSLLGLIINKGRSLVIAVNKWDGMSSKKRDVLKETLNNSLGFINFARVHFISALHDRGVGNLFESVNEAYQCATKRVSTAMLTRIMYMAVAEHQPPLVRGRRVKPKYAHAGGYNPPIFVIHGTQVTDLTDSYKRYLINYFRRSLNIMGTPIRMQFNDNPNPFDERRKILTLTQQIHKQKKFIIDIKKNK
ncbi:GTP-binding protein EngA [Candidatus Moranella endobia PCVAL]|uniref:GTPase Der n=1 Tax=Moranella endobia (strain PCIT) TaxID=903503 RepID=F7XXL1_MOREP|nr:ribosome biogenesis GTPase Der [Candidatus Moranella endobia]AEI74837.1 50S ribosomal subunit stability factor [Candidatus Moranella endobia PCIT]AGJ61083.1 GTP-binding protein EngA [Candidatus Moranella endobia PCVAL]